MCFGMDASRSSSIEIWVKGDNRDVQPYFPHRVFQAFAFPIFNDRTFCPDSIAYS